MPCGVSVFSIFSILLTQRKYDQIVFLRRCGGMADTRDLKSLGSNTVPVQVRPAAPEWFDSGRCRVGKPYPQESSVFMRKHQQRQIFEVINSIEQAQALGRYADCQDGGVALCGFINSIKGEGTRTAALLIEYCELVFKVNNGELNEQVLKKHLIKIKNSVRGELKPTKIEVVFFPYKASMADSLESIYTAAKNDPDCDAYWCPIPYYNYKPDQTLGPIQYEGKLYPEHFEAVDWQKYDLETRRPDIIFAHSPYDKHNFITCVHSNFHFEQMQNFTEMLCYIPYFISTSNKINEIFCVLPGTLYSDKVVVQSEKIKQTYIDTINAWIKQNDVNKDHFLWPKLSNLSEKFVALGSPKFDAVINASPEDFTLPDEWQQLINPSGQFGQPGQSRKKVVLYNTRFTGFHQGLEKMIEKLRFVLEFFKNRDDVVLWWRPHPLNMSSLHSMRPQYFSEYKSIVDNYKAEKWGIYDESEDLIRAIVLSDALFSDYSSLVGMFAVTGKPIMTQNVEILETTEKHTGEAYYNAFLERLEKRTSQYIAKTQDGFGFDETMVKSPYFFVLAENKYKSMEVLIRFVDSIKNNEERALFFCEAQKAYTKKLSENLDGTAGKSIFKHIKSTILESL